MGFNGYIYGIVGTAGWLNTLLSFKSQRKCCAPVRLCTSVQQDESPLVPPNSPCFCQQSQQNQWSWFHPGLDSRFHRNSDLILGLGNLFDGSTFHTMNFIVIIQHDHHICLHLLYRLSLQERRMRGLTHMMDLNWPTTRALLRWETQNICSL